MHLAESTVQAVMGLSTCGRTLVSHLDALGLPSDRFVAAHPIWIDDADRALLAARGAPIIHNPGSNMTPGKGLFTIRIGNRHVVRDGVLTTVDLRALKARPEEHARRHEAVTAPQRAVRPPCPHRRRSGPRHRGQALSRARPPRRRRQLLSTRALWRHFAVARVAASGY
jgi:hypothetical protein